MEACKCEKYSRISAGFFPQWDNAIQTIFKDLFGIDSSKIHCEVVLLSLRNVLVFVRQPAE